MYKYLKADRLKKFAILNYIKLQMRRPKILGVAIVAMATATMFSSCIETDEPAGIEKLRQAKAEFIAAETAYKTAEIARVNAETALEELNVKLQEVELAKKQYEAAIAEAKSELAIEEAKMALEDAQAEHKTHMATANKELAEAQQKYEIALKEIEIANAAALDPEMTMYDDYAQAYENMKNAKSTYLGYSLGSSFFNGTSQNLVKKQEALVKAEEELALTIAQDWDANDKATTYKWAVIGAQNAYDEINANYELISSLENIDSATIAAKIVEIIKQSSDLQKKALAMDVEIAELENIVAAKQADYDKACETYSNEYDKISVDINNYNSEAKFYSFDIKNDILKEYFLNNSVNFFTYNAEGKLTSSNVISNSNLRYALYSCYNSLLDACNYNIITEETLAKNTQTIKELKSQLTTYKETYYNDSLIWAKALETYKKAALDYKWSDNTYSTLFTEVSKAITAYNNAPEYTDALKQNIAKKIANYYKIRHAFDGYVNTNTVYYNGSKYVTFSEFFDGDDLTPEELSYMGYLYRSDVIGYNERNYGGAYNDLYEASYKLFEVNYRYTMYTEEETDELYSDGYLKNNYGSFGEYQYAIRKIEELQKRIDSRNDWVALQTEAQSLIDAYEAKIVELTNAKADKYAELNPLVEAKETANKALKEANNALADKDAEKDALKVEQDALDNILDAYDDQLMYNSDYKDLIASIKRNMEDAANELEDAKAKLEAFNNGEWDKDYEVEAAEEAVEDAKEAVALAEAANEEAKAAYEEAKAKFDAIYAIVSAAK
jgi:hypothetical protein